MKQTYQRGVNSSFLDALGQAVVEQPDEVLIPDARAGLTPADMVERKLLQSLRGASTACGPVRIEALRGGGTRPMVAPPSN